MRQIIKIIICMFEGHFYRPSCQMSFIQANEHAPMRKKKYQFTCERCSKKTPWMNQKQMDVFNKESCPTWGDKGSDSQNYRKNESFD